MVNTLSVNYDVLRIEHKVETYPGTSLYTGPYHNAETTNTDIQVIRDLLIEEWESSFQVQVLQPSWDEDIWFTDPSFTSETNMFRKPWLMPQWHAGFLNLQQIRNWFSNEACVLMHDAGFLLRIYSTTDVMFSKYQVAFPLESAIFKNTLNLLQI